MVEILFHNIDKSAEWNHHWKRQQKTVNLFVQNIEAKIKRKKTNNWNPMKIENDQDRKTALVNIFKSHAFKIVAFFLFFQFYRHILVLVYLLHWIYRICECVSFCQLPQAFFNLRLYSPVIIWMFLSTLTFGCVPEKNTAKCKRNELQCE